MVFNGAAFDSTIILFHSLATTTSQEPSIGKEGKHELCSVINEDGWKDSSGSVEILFGNFLCKWSKSTGCLRKKHDVADYRYFTNGNTQYCNIFRDTINISVG